VEQLSVLLKASADSIEDKPRVILLDHQYTPANFSWSSLKHHDKPRAEALWELCVPGMVIGSIACKYAYLWQSIFFIAQSKRTNFFAIFSYYRLQKYGVFCMLLENAVRKKQE